MTNEVEKQGLSAHTIAYPGPIIRFFVKSLCFVTLLLIINRSTGLLLPTGWENTSYYMKRGDFLQNHATNCNTVFFGSSRTFSHINPILFDSLNTLNGLQTNSYMLGSSSVFFNESLEHLHGLFNTEASSLKKIQYIFFELDDLITLSSINLHTPQASYYITPKSLFPLLRRLCQEELSPLKMITQISYYVSTCIVNTLQLGYGRDKMKHYLVMYERDKYFLDTQSGHRGLSYDLAQYRSGEYNRRHQVLMHDTMAIQQIFEQIEDAEALGDNGAFCNPDILETCIDLITEFQERGIHLVFVLPLRNQMKGSLKRLYQSLPVDHKIDMSKIASGIPELRQVAYWFDTGHLNTMGVRLYTRAFTEEVQKCQDAWHLNSE